MKAYYIHYCLLILFLLIYSSKEDILDDGKIKVLIYKGFFSHEIFPNFGTDCQVDLRLEVVRSNVIQPFDVVIIHFPHVGEFVQKTRHLRFATRRLMIILLLESPYAINFSRFDPFMGNSMYWKWMISYYTTSKFYLPYGKYVKKKVKDSLDREKIYKDFKFRKNSILVLISNCDERQTLRLRFIHKLRQYFDIQPYGACFNRPVNSAQRNELLRKHKFFLSFENSNCRDYITEKYWYSLSMGIIPLVYQHKSNRRLMIPGSYIDVRSFSRMRLLAQHLNRVSSDFNEYLKYFTYQQSFQHVRIDQLWLNVKCQIFENLPDLLRLPIVTDNTIHQTNNLKICERASGQKFIFRR